jgi:hypothetical protein
MEFDRRAAVAREPLLSRYAAWLVVTLAYLYVFPYTERINNPNENVRIWMTRAIVEHHVLNIDKVSREWGYVNDKATNGGHLYSSKAPGTSFLGVPVLFVEAKLHRLLGMAPPTKRQATLWLRVFSVELTMSLFLFFFARYVERVSGSRAARDLLVVGLGVGTMFYPYAVIFVGHAQAAALAFAGYMLLSGGFARGAAAAAGAAAGARDDAPPGGGGIDTHTPTPQLIWGGFLAALSVMFEYQALLVFAVLAVYAWARHRRRAAAFLAGAAPAGALLGLYHTVLFGRPWRFPYGYIENPDFLRTGHSAGFHGLALPRLSAMAASLFASDYGLFVFSPFLAIGLLCAALVMVRGPRREGALVVAVFVVMLIFLGGMSNWRAGWCVGPRYIATVVPFLAAAIAHAWRQVSARGRVALSVAVAGLVIVSVVLNGVSAAVYPHYPTEFNNPVFDLAFPLLGSGFVPYSLGLLVFSGLWSLAPLGIVLLVALSLAIGGEYSRPARWGTHAAIAVLIAALGLVSLSRYGRGPSPSEARAAAFVRSTWEPAPRK